MSDETLSDKTRASHASRPEGGAAASDGCGTEIPSDAGPGTAAEGAGDPEGEAPGFDAAPHDEDGLTVDEACVVIGCSREWLRRKIHSGEIATFRVGKRLRVTRAAISHVRGNHPVST